MSEYTKRALLKKDATCGAGHHSCLDVGYGNHCCEDSDYCYVNNSFHPACCPLGSNCIGDSPCKSTAFFCSHTAAQTSTSTLATATPTPSIQTGCCGRKCPDPGFYLCEQRFGGNCCKFGTECVSGGCIAPDELPSPSATARVQQHPGLDSRAKVAIGLSLGLSLLLGISVLIWCIKKKMKTSSYGQEQPSESWSGNDSAFASCGSSSPEMNARRQARRRTHGSILAAMPIFRFANEQEDIPTNRSAGGLFELDSFELPPPRSPSILPTPAEYIRRSLNFSSKN